MEWCSSGFWNSNSLFHATSILSFTMHTSIFHFHRVIYLFYSFPHKMFGCLLGLGSFDSLKRLLTCKQTSLPITFGGVGFISTSTITPITYLKSWALIVLVITIRFMIDQRPFLLEALAWVDNNIFFLKQHFNAKCDIQPPPAHACLFPFEQLIKQQMVSTWKFYFRTSTPSYPFQHAFQ